MPNPWTCRASRAEFCDLPPPQAATKVSAIARKAAAAVSERMDEQCQAREVRHQIVRRCSGRGLRRPFRRRKLAGDVTKRFEGPPRVWGAKIWVRAPRNSRFAGRTLILAPHTQDRRR